MPMDSLSVLDWSICVAYLGVVVALGCWFASGQHSNEDYFVGDRKMHWFPIGLSLFAGTFSSLSFVGLPREGAYEDYHLLLGILCIPLVVAPLIAWLFIPLYHRLKLTSVYEYLELRFDRKIRLFASILFMLYTIGWMGNMLVAVGTILQVVLKLSDANSMITIVAIGLFATFYTTLGGVKAVVWTDALQAFALGGGMLVLLFLAMARIEGGLDTVLRVGAQHERFAMFRMEFGFDKGNFFGACAFGLFVYLAGHSVHFTAVQRYVSMPSVQAARRSLIVSGVMIGLVCTLFFFVGSTLFAFYQQTGNPIYQELADDGKGDQLLPHFVMTEAPFFGLPGLLLAGLFAAAMSSIDSGVNSLTASIVCDWRRQKAATLGFSRGLTIAFGIATILTALILQQIGGPVFRNLMVISGSFLGLLLGVFLLGILSPRSNRFGAWIGLTFGIVVFIVALKAGLASWWFGACTTSVTLIVGLVASLAFPPPPASKLKGLEVGWTTPKIGHGNKH